MEYNIKGIWCFYLCVTVRLSLKIEAEEFVEAKALSTNPRVFQKPGAPLKRLRTTPPHGESSVRTGKGPENEHTGGFFTLTSLLLLLLPYTHGHCIRGGQQQL